MGCAAMSLTCVLNVLDYNTHWRMKEARKKQGGGGVVDKVVSVVTPKMSFGGDKDPNTMHTTINKTACATNGRKLNSASHTLFKCTVEPCVLWGPRSLQVHGFESCPRSECRLGFLTRGNGFLAAWQVPRAGCHDDAAAVAECREGAKLSGGVTALDWASCRQAASSVSALSRRARLNPGREATGRAS
ncbi:hypothetical protein E2C01_003130 [Portunus trituberculatus]|uniref:Uncharacterized protein n=1 Tax=Portunus trituberculatus TaxID=210409 RepID=A0A5B7CSP4_PORTR|nr:hypothetical protein [Portunus trituberculatus]